MKEKKNKKKESSSDEDKLSTFERIEREFEETKKRFLKSLKDEETKTN